MTLIIEALIPFVAALAVPLFAFLALKNLIEIDDKAVSRKRLYAFAKN